MQSIPVLLDMTKIAVFGEKNTDSAELKGVSHDFSFFWILFR